MGGGTSGLPKYDDDCGGAGGGKRGGPLTFGLCDAVSQPPPSQRTGGWAGWEGGRIPPTATATTAARRNSRSWSASTRSVLTIHATTTTATDGDGRRGPTGNGQFGCVVLIYHGVVRGWIILHWSPKFRCLRHSSRSLLGVLFFTPPPQINNGLFGLWVDCQRGVESNSHCMLFQCEVDSSSHLPWNCHT